MPTSAEVAQQLAKYDANKKSSADVLNSAMTQFGVPEIRQRVAGLRTTLGNTENALNNVDPSVTGRTSRSLVTEAQRSRIVNKEREPIAAQYGQQSRALGDESANLSEQSRAAQMLAEGQMNDYTTGRNALQSQYADTVASETEQRRKLEADRAYELSKSNSDRDYQLSLMSAKKPASVSAGDAKTAVYSSLNSDISANVADFKNKPKGWTEKTLIPQLIAQYPELSGKEIIDKVYQLRKQYE
jgi:hypothetical protein